jgi:DNA invertase Pin-like site-specific DNA recombinase
VALDAFAAEHGLDVVGFFVENESGASLQRPELFRLLRDSKPNDILLIEQVDRLSRLTAGDWQTLRTEIAARQVRVVALDLPTSWAMASGKADEFTSRMFSAINSMLLDMLAAVARKDYDDRRRRQAQGIAKAVSEGKYRGHPEDVERNAGIAKMLKAKVSWSAIQAATGCSRSTIKRIADRSRLPAGA